MIELPEALCLAKQLNENISGKTVSRVRPPTKPHKFCWFSLEPAEYERELAGARVTGAEGFGIYAELQFENGRRLCVNDGVNLRLTDAADAPKDYQLLMLFEDGGALAFTVAMYGGIVLHSGDYDNEYYLKSRRALSPFAPEFDAYYYETLKKCKPTMSAKAFLATEQRFGGIGNGVLQDILFHAGVNPRLKLCAIGEEERERLLFSVRTVLKSMIDGGGRDTEKDIFGAPGGYKTRMSKNTLSSGCPKCGGELVKESYLGGSVYYCPKCQPISK